MTWTRDEERSNWAYLNNIYLLPPVRHGPFQEMSLQQIEAVLDAKIRKHMKDFFGHDGTRQDTDGTVRIGKPDADSGVR